jgi:hypothetical protein
MSVHAALSATHGDDALRFRLSVHAEPDIVPDGHQIR